MKSSTIAVTVVVWVALLGLLAYYWWGPNDSVGQASSSSDPRHAADSPNSPRRRAPLAATPKIAATHAAIHTAAVEKTAAASRPTTASTAYRATDESVDLLAEERFGTQRPFEVGDGDGDGRVSQAEAKGTFFQNRFPILDANGDAFVDREEFQADLDCEDDVARELLAADADHNGMLSRHELEVSIAQGGSVTLAEFNLADRDGNDEIDRWEMNTSVQGMGMRRLAAKHRAHPLPQAPVKDWSERFGTALALANADKDRDGRIGRTESAKGHMKSRFAAVDGNDDGFIDKEEYQAMLDCEDDLQKQFQRADADRSGVLSRAEFETAANWGAYLLPRHFDQFDRDRSGELERTELINGIKPLAAERLVYQRAEKLMTADPFISAQGRQDGRLSVEEIKANPALVEHFALVDANGDGIATRGEWRRYRDAEFAEARRLMAIDVDRDGTLTKDEAHAPPLALTGDAFARFDADQDGRLSPGELSAVVRERTAAKLAEAIDSTQGKPNNGPSQPVDDGR